MLFSSIKSALIGRLFHLIASIVPYNEVLNLHIDVFTQTIIFIINESFHKMMSQKKCLSQSPTSQSDVCKSKLKDSSHLRSCNQEM